MSEDEILLDVKNLHAYYPSRKGLIKAVRNVSFTVKSGECLGILGESGCGKSSMALSLVGLFNRMAKFAAGSAGTPGLLNEFEKEGQERAGTQGQVIFRGHDILQLDNENLVKLRGKEISMIPQGLTHALNPQYSVGMQTGEPLEIHDESVRLIEMKKKVLDFLNLVRLADSGTRYVMDPGSFSGGEAQRILIAMALISGPYLVIADEPTSALDVTIQRQIMNVLQMIKKEFDVSIILISHDAGVIAELSDRVAVMYAGRIMEVGEAVQMFHHPAHPYTMGLMGSFPTIAMMRMRAGGKRPILRGIKGEPPDMTDLPEGCPFHPRCDYCTEVCKTEFPKFEEIETDHWISCHNYGNIVEE
ncbi:MAG: ABC transporter ATP-binding protein [Candidatus Thorarchaeota archaeon]|jgi:peptide/nickel transport system ATP-binding protein/oligopeptide transport system ATP-binding protein